MAATDSCTEARMRRGEALLLIIIGVEVGSFVAGLIWPALRQALLLEWHPSPTPAMVEASYHRPWTLLFLVYALAHGGPMHLLFNMLFLWLTGRIFLKIAGGLELLTYFIGGILIAGIGFMTSCWLMDPSHEVVLSGASGGVLALSGVLWCVADELPAGARLRMPRFVGHPFVALTPWRVRLLTGLIIGVSMLSGLTAAALATHLSALAFGLCCGFVKHNRPRCIG